MSQPPAPKSVSQEATIFARAGVARDATVPDQLSTSHEFLPQTAHVSSVVHLDRPVIRNAEYEALVREVFQGGSHPIQGIEVESGALPRVGSNVAGFHLLEILGRGALGSVYLAQQEGLTSRSVAVKISVDTQGEVTNLSQLQHTNVMPIYSVHDASPLTVFCMPFLGRTTFAQLSSWIRKRPNGQMTGAKIVSQLLSLRKEPAEKELAPALRTLQGLDSTDAILWLMTRVAEGLAHAHDKGILHLDLKPANILLADHGEPLLLDFNVSMDVKQTDEKDGRLVGGTLHYMSRHQLLSYCGKPHVLDVGADIYAFGLIFFELLTGRHEFERDTGLSNDLCTMVQLRSEAPPSLRAINPLIPPALEAIVHRCLAPSRNERYRSTHDLICDLERQWNSQPLRFANNPSIRERVNKWARRHRSLVSGSTVALVAVLFLATAMGLAVSRGRQLEHVAAAVDAQSKLSAFQEYYKLARARLYARLSEPDQLRDGLNHAEKALAIFSIDERNDWRNNSGVQYLSATDQSQLENDVADLFVAMARGMVVLNPKDPNLLAQALRLNYAAQSLDSRLTTSRSFWMQRAELLREAGQDDSPALKKAEATPVVTTRDLFWQASDLMLSSQMRKSLPLLQDAVQMEPDSFWAWFLLGNCFDRLEQNVRAESCYDTCVALWPAFPTSYFHRGIARMRQKQFDRAIQDFDLTIKVQPTNSEAFINRALCKMETKNDRAAEKDLSHAMSLNSPETRIYFLRSRVRQRLGDVEGSKEDFAEGLRQVPADDKSWIARGLARMAKDPPGARSDFEQALRFNPRSLPAAQNLAHVLSEHLQRPSESISVLNAAIDRHPEAGVLYCGRGVLHARQGKDDNARADARAALARDPSPENQYQAGCVFALTAKRSPDDSHTAINLLRTALRQNYGHDLLATDQDLDPIREAPEFRQLLSASRLMNGKRSSSQVGPSGIRGQQ